MIRSHYVNGLIALYLAGQVGIGMAADVDVEQSGAELYQRYCASCHGVSGRGDGPVSKSLSVEVPDLTRFSRRHRDFYNRELVERIIDGRHIIGAHGTRDMPVWGDAFSRAHLGDPDAERIARLAIARLADYVWLLQAPPAQPRQ